MRAHGFIVLICVVLVFPHGDARPYNSEEHKLGADVGVAQVVVSPSVRLPAGLAFKSVTSDQYLSAFRNAKLLAVGFASNDPNDYSQWKEKVQDNCYWHAFDQLEYNKKLWIPPANAAPSRVLVVPGYVNAQPTSFTFGQLVALYGDYRRTTYCSPAGSCYLTDDDVTWIRFGKGDVANTAFYCPSRVFGGDYLQAIGSGLVPPFGTAGNTFANTAGDTEYDEAGWWGDEMLRIANVNDWHFSTAAIAWYVGMHRLALLYADSARSDPRYWIKALHYEANGLHSLTDLFALGHVVTNRDATSYSIIKGKSLEGEKAYAWMENVLSVGGGQRASDGTVALTAELPAVADAPGIRNDFLDSYRGTISLASRANAERKYHDEFNGSGAQVRNLNGDTFHILGDAGLRTTWGAGQAGPVITAAVQASVQALFDAFAALESGSTTVADLGRAGSPYFRALKFVPVFIVSDPNNYFLGRWALYAKGVDDISGAGKVPQGWERCRIPFLSGKDWAWPAKQQGACTSF